MRECPTCGFPLRDAKSPDLCPKCDEDLTRIRAKKPLVIDLAHQGESRHAALEKLQKAVSECLWNGHPLLKVIHGHGSSTGRSVLKPHILAAMQAHAASLGGVVYQDGDNPGAHILSFDQGPAQRRTT